MTSSPPLSHFFEHTIDLLALASLTGHFCWLSPNVERLLGWDAPSLLGHHVLELVHPAEREAAHASFAQLATDRVSLEGVELRYRHRQGHFIILQWNITSKDGQLYCVGRDVTERHRVSALAEERMRYLLKSEELSRVGYWCLNIVEQTNVWSPEVYRIYGVDPQHFKPTQAAGIAAYHPDDRALVTRYLERAIAAREPFEFEARLVRPDGTTRWVLSRGFVREHEGEVVEVFGVFQDITEQREIQRRIAQRQRLSSLETLAAGISHEVNNPLAYLKANLGMIQRELSALSVHASGALSGERWRELGLMLEECQEGVHRIGKIAQGLRAFSRPAQEALEYVCVERVIHAALQRTSVLTAGANVSVDIARDLVVVAQETPLVEVVVNLLTNAAQAISSASIATHTIALRALRERDEVLIEVEDGGVGISPAQAPHIFDPFFTTKPPGQGMGLGLAICHGILASYHGTIELVRSDARGALMRLRLPAARGESLIEGSETTPSMRRALIVERELFLRRALANMLRDDFSVVHASSALEAAQLLGHERGFDAIFCDLATLQGAQPQLAQALQHPHMQQRLILMLSPEEQGLLDPQLGIEHPVLIKPFDRGQLDAALMALKAS